MIDARGLLTSIKALKAGRSGLGKAILMAVMVLATGISGQLFAEVPAAMQKDMENLNAAFYEALKVIDTKSESEALAELAAMRPRIEAQARAYAEKWAGTELSEEDEMEMGRKMLETPFFKDMYALLGNPAFMNKIENSPALQKEYAALMGIMDEEEEQASDAYADPGSTVLSFSVDGAVPYAGSYTVSGNEDQAFAHFDENNLFVVEVSSTLDGGELQFAILSETAETGEQKWSMEMQVIIQSWDEEQNEVIQLSNYYNEGSITFDNVEDVGGVVSGSFEGKFFDDTQATEKPLTVSGTFSVTRVQNAY